MRCGLRSDQHEVTVRNVRVDHRIAADLEHVRVAAGCQELRDGQGFGCVLIGLDRTARGDLADDRDHVRLADARLRHEFARQAEPKRRIGGEPDGPGLRRATLEEALALEDLKVMVNCGGRSQADRTRDLSNRGWVAARAQGRGDVVEDLDFAFGVVPGHGRLLSGHHDTEQVFYVKC